jgi:hypothetical protein
MTILAYVYVHHKSGTKPSHLLSTSHEIKIALHVWAVNCNHQAVYTIRTHTCMLQVQAG